MHLLQAFAKGLAALVVVILIFVFKQIYHHYTSALRRLPGPLNPSLLWGHMKQLRMTVSGFLDCLFVSRLRAVKDSSVSFTKWTKEYGSTMSVNGFFSVNGLVS